MARAAFAGQCAPLSFAIPYGRRSPEKSRFPVAHDLSPGSHLLYVIKSLSARLGSLGCQALPRPKELCGEFAVKFIKLLRLSDKVRKSLPCEFGLNLNGIVERPHTHELAGKGRALLQRFPGVVHVGIRNGLNADWTIARRRGCHD